MEKEIIKGNASNLAKVIRIFLIVVLALFILCIVNVPNELRTSGNLTFIPLALFLALPLYIFGMLYLCISKTEIIVTNKRVYGTGAFKKRVDLPLDLISVVATSFFKGITIGTSSGKISFTGISNNEEIHTEISKLLNNRQAKKQELGNNTNITEELKQYKELLDNGVITQEEFDTKKKQLLNL